MQMLGLPITKKLIVLTPIALSLSGCLAPVVLGGSSTAAVMGSRDKGIKGAFSDTSLSTKIKMKLYEFNPDMHAKITVNVQNGEVLLMGIVTDASWKEKAEELAKTIEGVTSVINNIETEGEEDLGTLSSDSWLTTKIKSKLMFADDLYSLNYSVKTINSVVYLMGTANDQPELDKILDLVSKVGGVKKVVNYIKIKGQENAETEAPQNLGGSEITAQELPPPPQNSN
jgi:osmotically-inducible protein OsmY